MSTNNKRIAVLYDCSFPFNKGGGEKRFYEISRRLVKRGWEIDWYTMKAWSGPNELEQDGIKYKAIMPPKNLYTPAGRRSINEALSYGFSVSKLLVLRNYPIIHAGQWPYFHLFAAKLYSLLNNGALIIDWWEVWGNYWYEYLGLKGIAGIIIEKASSRLTPHLIAISELGCSQLAHLSNSSVQALNLIHNGINFDDIQNVSVNADFFDITYLGRLKNHKNVDHVIKIVHILKQNGFLAKLQIIGEGPEREFLEALSREMGVANQVRFWGNIDSDQDVYRRMKSSSLFINPSIKEGGGSITTLEANACGLPVVGYKHDLGISPELVIMGENGYLIEDIQPSALAAKIKEILEDKSLLNYMKKRAVEISREFDWNKIVDKYEALYMRLLRREV